MTKITIGWMCWPNTTADNYVPEGIRQSLHRHMCSVRSWTVLKPATHFFLLLPLERIAWESPVHIFRHN
jgi:hypothetical protein